MHQISKTHKTFLVLMFILSLISFAAYMYQSNFGLAIVAAMLVIFWSFKLFQITENPISVDCGYCHKCNSLYRPTIFTGMILCTQCGNKRCPKASDHELECTGSNKPNQPGSVYQYPKLPSDFDDHAVMFSDDTKNK